MFPFGGSKRQHLYIPIPVPDLADLVLTAACAGPKDVYVHDYIRAIEYNVRALVILVARVVWASFVMTSTQYLCAYDINFLCTC